MEEEGFNEEFWRQRAGTARKHNSRLGQPSDIAANRRGLYILPSTRAKYSPVKLFSEALNFYNPVYTYIHTNTHTNI